MRLVSSLAALPLFTVFSFGVLGSAHADPLTLSIGVIQVGTGKPYPQFAYKSWVAEQLVTQTELIKANPKDALAYAKRAGFWKSTAITNELTADNLKFEQANADIKKAIELAPKDPQIYLFVARAVDTGEQRERAFQMALDLGSVEAAEELAALYARDIFSKPDTEITLKKMAQLQSIGKTVIAKFGAPNVFVALCVAGAYQAISEITPDKKAAFDNEARRRINTFSQTEPQKTHDAMSQIARWMQENSRDDLAKSWVEIADAIPNIKTSGLNFYVRSKIARAAKDEKLVHQLLKDSLWRFRADAPDAKDAGVALYEVEDKAGDLRAAQSALERALYVGADSRYWLQVGDLAFAVDDFKQAVAAYQTADMLNIGETDNHALRLEMALAQYLAGDSAAAAKQYEANIYGYDNPRLLAHQKLLESQLRKTPDSAVLKTALENIKTYISSPDQKPKHWEPIGDDRRWSQRPHAPKP